ncbi:FecR domain-containing protein [Marinobacter changyiensis]|uniref:FecR domain-containing protein n=1 Tax=Marinobacter changyiensis TaxID=2604091 RepID=UPI001263E960|nr:FecR domain-containing protein [Marinobacter changyiensis]
MIQFAASFPKCARHGRAFIHACLFSWACLAANTVSAELPVALGSQGALVQTNSSSAPDWHYSLRPDEGFEQVAEELLENGKNALQLATYNNIADIRTVRAGDSIRIPLHWLKRQPEPATVMAVTGQGQVRVMSSGYRVPLQAQMLLRAGDEITTQSGSATIRLADGSLLRIEENSQLVFNRLTQFGRTGMVDTRLRLERGEVSIEVKPLVEGGSRFEIETPSAVAAVRGTAFALQSAPGITRLQVTEGIVAFGPRGKTRSIPAGYSATVDTMTRSTVDLRRLPPVPETTRLPDSIQRLPIQLGWTPNGAPRHRLDIFDVDTGHRVARSQTSAPDFALDYLDNGRYEIQVSAVTARGVAGIPSSQTVDIELQAVAATNLTPTSGARVDEDMPVFSWNYRGDNEVGRIEIAETDDFAELIATSEWAPDESALPSRPLEPGQYYWRVVTEAGGNSVATSEPRTLIVNGTLPPVNIININYIDNQVRIFWQQVNTANDYLLQLSEDPSFERIVKEANIDDTTAALRLIPGRRYFVRLRALSDGPLASRWGPGRELFIE